MIGEEREGEAGGDCAGEEDGEEEGEYSLEDALRRGDESNSVESRRLGEDGMEALFMAIVTDERSARGLRRASLLGEDHTMDS